MSYKTFAISLISAAAISLGIAAPSLAEPAILVGQVIGSRINVRSLPTTAAASPHYGLVGDRVEVLSTTRGRDHYIWYYVEFQSGARGWVRGDYVSVDGEGGC